MTAHPVANPGGPADVPEPTGRDLILVVLGQFALMGFGALLAVLIAHTFGKSRATDAFFAAYGLYSIGLVAATSLRLTAVPALVADRSPDALARIVGAVVALTIPLAIPLVLFASQTASLLVPGDPDGVATVALRWLWLALSGQLVAATALAMLAVAGAFRAVAFVTGTGGLVSVLGFIAARNRFGLDAASGALALSGVYMAAVSVWFATIRGHRFARPHRDMIIGWVTRAATLVWASAAFLGPAFAYVAAIAVATRTGAGEATLLSYAYVLGGILVTATTYIAASVQSPSITADEDRAGAAFDAALSAVRATVALVGPLLFVIWLVGEPAISWVLGVGFADEDVHRIVVILLVLTGWNLGTAVGVFAIVELLAAARLARLAALACLLVVSTTAGAAALSGPAGSVGVAAAMSGCGLGIAVWQARVAFPGRSRRLFAELGGWLVRELAVLAVAVVPVLATRALGGDAAMEGVAVASAIVLVGVGSACAWPRERTALIGAVRPALQDRASA